MTRHILLLITATWMGILPCDAFHGAHRSTRPPSILQGSNIAQIPDANVLTIQSHLRRSATATQDGINAQSRISQLLQSLWFAQELLTTFDKGELDAIVVAVPAHHQQQSLFTMKLSSLDSTIVLHNATDMPSTKTMKQAIRDVVAPQRHLGHSDDNCVTCAPTPTSTQRGDQPQILHRNMADVSITYCTGCRWLQRAAYLLQEIGLDEIFHGETRHETDVQWLTLIPSPPPYRGGQFTIAYNRDVVFERFETKRFPEVDETLALIRQRQHSSAESATDVEDDGDVDAMDDDDAATARQYFGVY